MKINVIHNVICNFYNTESNLQYGHSNNANGHSFTCVYYFSKIPINYRFSEFNK